MFKRKLKSDAPIGSPLELRLKGSTDITKGVLVSKKEGTMGVQWEGSPSVSLYTKDIFNEIAFITARESDEHTRNS